MVAIIAFVTFIYHLYKQAQSAPVHGMATESIIDAELATFRPLRYRLLDLLLGDFAFSDDGER